MDNKKEGILFAEVLTPDKTLFKGEVNSISTLNEKGPLDVLYRHENFITSIKEFVVVRLPNGQVREFNTNRGILRVAANSIRAFLDFEKL